MLIQNTGSSAAPASRLTSDSAPVAVAAPKTEAASAEAGLRQATAKVIADQQAAQQNPPPSSAQVRSAVDNINKAMKQLNSNVEFSIDEETQRTIVKVVESESKEVIRQFPSEEILAISRAIDQMQKVQQGLLIKQQA